MIKVIASKEFKQITRDGKIRLSASILILMLIVSLVTAAIRYVDISAERATAQSIIMEQWLGQGEKNPHAAAHYGVYAFKTVTPLAFFDTGISSYAGIAIWLEAHKKNEAFGEPVKDMTSMARQGELTAALTLQILLPLLVIFLTYSTFSGERESGTFLQIKSLGVPPIKLLIGKAAGISMAIGLIILPLLIIPVTMLFFSSGGAQFLTQGVSLIGLYILYSAVFMFLSMAVSAYSKTAKNALIIMLSFWVITTFILPRISADMASTIHHLPSYHRFAQLIETGKQEGVHGQNPASVIEKRKQKLLKLYKANDIKELPINFQGIIFSIQEELGNQVYDKYYGELNALFYHQLNIYKLMSIVSPRLSVQLASMELSGTGLTHHIDFLNQAETYRRKLVTAMNNDMTMNSISGDPTYRANSQLWGAVEPFSHKILSLPSSRDIIGANIMILLTWLCISFSVALLTVKHLLVRAL